MKPLSYFKRILANALLCYFSCGMQRDFQALKPVLLMA